jgi:cytochrome c
MCHAVTGKLIGPAMRDVAAKYKGRAELESYLVGKIRKGGQGVWGAIPMPPQEQAKDEDVKAIARWLAAGAP